MKLYQESSEEYLNYIKEINKNEIKILEEKHIQELILPFDNLTLEQKQIICNKYFRKALKERVNDFNYKLQNSINIYDSEEIHNKSI